MTQRIYKKDDWSLQDGTRDFSRSSTDIHPLPAISTAPPVKSWSSETVAEWVRTVLPEGGDTTTFVSNLVEEEVSGSELVSVGDAHLKAMGLTKIGHCLKLLNAIKALK